VLVVLVDRLLTDGRWMAVVDTMWRGWRWRLSWRCRSTISSLVGGRWPAAPAGNLAGRNRQ
jgi:hypothetical protein